MPRPKRDPSIRQNEFIDAAKTLFFSKGYAGTSVRDILDAVGDKSVSPSVFYYYFPSKEDIYHAVMENYAEKYMAKLEACLRDESIKIEERIAGMMSSFLETLAESKRAVDTSDAVDNRLFVLDIRERITRRITGMWETAIISLPWLHISVAEAGSLALYVIGGIYEMVYDFVFVRTAERQDIKSLANSIIQFSARVLDVPKPIRNQFIKRLDKVLFEGDAHA